MNKIQAGVEHVHLLEWNRIQVDVEQDAGWSGTGYRLEWNRIQAGVKHVHLLK